MAEEHAWQGHAWQGVCMAGGMHDWGDAWQIPRNTVNDQAVPILLECILVRIFVQKLIHFHSYTSINSVHYESLLEKSNFSLYF